jgi:hypothetical protein
MDKGDKPHMLLYPQGPLALVFAESPLSGQSGNLNIPEKQTDI